MPIDTAVSAIRGDTASAAVHDQLERKPEWRSFRAGYGRHRLLDAM